MLYLKPEFFLATFIVILKGPYPFIHAHVLTGKAGKSEQWKRDFLGFLLSSSRDVLQF